MIGYRCRPILLFTANQRRRARRWPSWNLVPNQFIAYINYFTHAKYYNGSTLIADSVKNWPSDLTILDDRPASSKSRT